MLPAGCPLGGFAWTAGWTQRGAALHSLPGSIRGTGLEGKEEISPWPSTACKHPIHLLLTWAYLPSPGSGPGGPHWRNLAQGEVLAKLSSPHRHPPVIISSAPDPSGAAPPLICLHSYAGKVLGVRGCFCCGWAPSPRAHPTCWCHPPGRPECGQHGHTSFQGQGGLDGAAAAHRTPGGGPVEGFYRQTGGHWGEGR